MALPEQFLPAISVEQYLELERTSEIRHEFLDGLVYETEKYDRGEKFRRYRTAIESLQDYVLVSQDQFRLEHHHHEADGAWSQTEVTGTDGLVVLKSIDSTIPLAEVFRNTEAGK